MIPFHRRENEGTEWYTRQLSLPSKQAVELGTAPCFIDSVEGNGNPLQYSCLEDPRDRGAWWAAVHRVAQSWTRLKRLSMQACTGEGNGNPLQCSCLENPRQRGAWWAAVYGLAQSRTRLKWLSSSSSNGWEEKGRAPAGAGNQVSGAIWLLSVQKGHSQLSVDLSFLIRKQKLWAGCFRRLLLSPTTQGNPGSGARVQSAGLWRQQKPAFQNTESPPLCACRQLISGGLPLLTLPSPGSGIWGHWGVIWLRTLGPSFRGVTRVRLQVTQIATLCVVPRGGCPGDSRQGQRPRLLLWYGWPLIPHDSPGGGRGGSACSSKHLQIL